MRVVALVLALISLSVAGAFAQTVPSVPSVVITPGSADLSTPRQVQISGLAPDEADVVVLFDPSGQQTVTQSQADSSGTINLTLQPPNGSWQVGMYRVAVGRPDGDSISNTFVASDGQPHLFAEPNLPSPWSALNFVGTGLAANQQLDLHLHLTGGQGGIQVIPVTTDADGNFSIFVWPQQRGLAFFAAGDYLVTLPAAGLSTPFTLREHPDSATPSVIGSPVSGVDLPVHFESYPRNTYVWGLYADLQGNEVGQFLVGLGDSGRADAHIPLPILAPGQYLLATPYDWGETAFTVPDPTATPTVKPTSTPTPTPTATPRSVRRPPTATPKTKPRVTYHKQSAAASKAAFCHKHPHWRRCQAQHKKASKTHKP